MRPKPTDRRSGYRARSAASADSSSHWQRLVFYTVAIIILILFFFWMRNRSSPEPKPTAAVQGKRQTLPVYFHLQKIHKAMLAYAQDPENKGLYPERLEQLVPKYIQDESSLLPPLDSGSGKGLPYLRGPAKKPGEGLSVLLMEAKVRPARDEMPEGRYTLYSDGTILFEIRKGNLDL